MQKKLISLLLTAVILLILTGCESGAYKAAQKSYDAGDYAAAAEAFRALGEYADSADMAEECSYLAAKSLLDSGDYQEAMEAFAALEDYRDSSDLVLECSYLIARDLLAEESYADAVEMLETLGDYRDSAELLKEAKLGATKATLLGTWSSQWPAGAIFDELLRFYFGDNAAKYANVARMPAPYELTFREDLSFTLRWGADTPDTFIPKLRERIHLGIRQAILKVFDGGDLASSEEWQAILEEEGVSSLEELFKKNNDQSLDEYVTGIVEYLFSERAIQAYLEQYTLHGVYEVGNGSFTLSCGRVSFSGSYKPGKDILDVRNGETWAGGTRQTFTRVEDYVDPAATAM